jgi:hypothetical protein
VTADIAKGRSPYGAYQVGDIDDVNIVNGNLSLHIPLLSYPQRGKTLGMNFYIYSNDKQWYITNLKDVFPSGGGSQYYSGVWGGPALQNQQVPLVGTYVGRDQDITLGQDMTSSSWAGGESYDQYVVTTQFYGNYVLEGNGAKHYIGDNETQSCQAQGGGSCPTVYSLYGAKYPATDGSNWAPGSGGFVVSSTAISPSGNKYNTVVTSSGSTSSFTTTETDTNGNQIVESSTLRIY